MAEQKHNSTDCIQPEFTCSKATMEIPKQCVFTVNF